MTHSKLYFAGLYLQSALYAVAGLNHLLHPRTYLAIMPDHYSYPAFWVVATGFAELAGAAGLLLSSTRRVAAIGIILMLLGYLDVHFFMLQHAADRFANLPYLALVVRLPLQLVLLAWAAFYVHQPRES